MVSELAAASPDDLEAAMSTLLARWRVGRQPELADALDALSARITRPPIPGKTAKARHQAWLGCAKLGDPADVPRLLAILLEGTASKSLEQKLDTLVARGPDPRVATSLIEIVAAQRHFVTIQWLWSRLLDAIDKMGDPRGLAALRATIPGHEPPRGFRYMGEREVFSLRRYIWERLPPLVRRLEQIAIAPLDDADRAALDRLRAPSRSERTEADLLDAVLANPDDDMPRSVLADALQARGNARGELIALQLARGRNGNISAREKALVKALAAEIVGPLAPVLFDPIINRGFLAGGRAVITESHRALCDHRWWRTVESLSTDDLRLLRRSDLPALRRIRPGMAARDLLAGEALPQIEALVLTGDQVRRRGTELAASSALPGLRELVVEDDRAPEPIELAAILGGPLGARLESLVIRADILTDVEVDAWQAARPRPSVRFELPSLSAQLSGDLLEIELHSKDAAERVRRNLSRARVRVVVTKAPRGTDVQGLERQDLPTE